MDHSVGVGVRIQRGHDGLAHHGKLGKFGRRLFVWLVPELNGFEVAVEGPHEEVLLNLERLVHGHQPAESILD